MRPDLGAKLLLQLDQAWVEVRVGACRRAQLLGLGHAVAGTEAAVGEDIEIDVDALLLEAVDQVVEPVHALGVELPRVVEALALGELEDVGGGPVAVELVEAHEVDAELGEPPGDLLAVAVRGEVGHAVEVGAPEARLGAVLEEHFAVAALQEAALAGGLLIREHVAEVDRGIIPGEVENDGAA